MSFAFALKNEVKRRSRPLHRQRPTNQGTESSSTLIEELKMIRQFESVGLRVPSMRSVPSSMQPRITWPRHLSLIGLLLFTLLYVLIPTVAAQEPQRDPAGTATGDKHQALDAAGNPFVVAEPTDKTCPRLRSLQKLDGSPFSAPRSHFCHE